MSFIHPLGLLALLAIPLIVIIYIIKNKYTEQTIASTYIWTLSERFLKRRNPINKLQKWLSLILQITAVVLMALTIANPVFYIPGQAADYCFVLDGSESMQIEKDGVTRWSRGKEKIAELIEESGNGSTYTLICVGDAPVVVYSRLSDKGRAIDLLDDATPSEFSVSLESALADAQKMFDEDPAIKTYLFTDRNYSAHDNVEVVNLYAEEVNVALISAECSLEGNGLLIDGKIIAYGGDVSPRISVYIDGREVASARSTLDLIKGVSSAIDVSDSDVTEEDVLNSCTPFSIRVDGVTDYQSVRIALDDADALASDNELVLYNVKHDKSFSTLIVCNNEEKKEDESSFFLESALKALGHTQIDLMSCKEYESQANGLQPYGLYIFNGYTPEKTPSEGAVWFFSPSVTDGMTGFAYQNETEGSQKMMLEYSKSSSSVVKKLLTDVDINESVYISGYSSYTMTRDFTTLLSCDGVPMLFVGSNAYGKREVVFAFDLHRSDLPLTYAFLPILNNLLEYTFPPIVDRSDYVCGDIVKINVDSNEQNVRITAPSGEEAYLSANNAESEYTLTEIGLYKLTVGIGSDSRELYLYSRTPAEESVVNSEAAEFSLLGEASSEKKDGIYEDLIALFIILAVICIADWMVYCYEQYQLR